MIVWVLIGAGGALSVVTIALGLRRARDRYMPQHALGDPVEAEFPEQDFYGPTALTEDRDWQADQLEAGLRARGYGIEEFYPALDWRDQIAAGSPERDFYGSMTLAGEQKVHYDFRLEAHHVPTWYGDSKPADPVPWGDLQSDARIETEERPLTAHELDIPPGPDLAWREMVALGEELEGERAIKTGEPTAVEVAASRALHGYIPELDTDAEVMPDGGFASAQPLVSSGPGDLSSLTPGPGTLDGLPIYGVPGVTGDWVSQLPEDPDHTWGKGASGLGPRAQAVLDRYERRFQERWAMA